MCRSPVAERLLVARLDRAPDVAARVRVASAGTHAALGRAMHPLSARALEELGGRPADFRSQPLSAELATSADLVLTMTRRHRRTVLALDPRGLRRTFTLSEAAALAGLLQLDDIATLPLHERAASLASRLDGARARRRGGDDDIVDPIDQPARAHRAAAERIATDLGFLVDALVPAVGHDSSLQRVSR